MNAGIVQAHCPAICAIGPEDSQCGAVVEIQVIWTKDDWKYNRGMIDWKLKAVVPTQCSYGHVLDEATKARFAKAAVELQGVAA